ncbi:HEPN-associated N-terminal domain-containing protein [Paraburkholderia terrae]|uniref:HEPN-associated N-terminal domain-containing protein n=1 Tax=Paraburkholderia terrae TaxID=311230 RepID=UPI003365399C
MSIERVCSSCFDDADLRAWIRDVGGPRGCDACEKFDSPTCKIADLCRHIESCLKKYWGFAVDQLPYESAEGGYLAPTWDTYDLLTDEVGLTLPRDYKGTLFHALIREITDEVWCEYNWLTLDHDVALRTSWERFCETVKYKRRFFFHNDGTDDRDSYTAASLLDAIARISQSLGLVRELTPGIRLWRARPDIGRGRRVTATDFGPPPVECALQSNRMNPPGIPMLYLASSASTALSETRATEARIGQWQVVRSLRILDLRRLPDVPGLFAAVTRNQRLGLRFLRRFADDIMVPVERDQRVHVDYLPSQVITEFIRDYPFEGGRVDGIAYGSTVHHAGWNVALFTDPVELGLAKPSWGKTPDPSLRFARSLRVSV